jgi:hypothetical protein
MTSTQIEAIRVEAKRDAQLFVDEFGEALDPSETDLDGEAWAMADVKRELLSDEDLQRGWEIYQSELVRETKRLAVLASSLPTTTRRSSPR